MSEDNFFEMKSKIKKSVYDIVEKLEGSFSAEHGIGLVKKRELMKYSSEIEVRLMREIKKSLDPNYILNPGKVI